jgi:hypothetical protein
MDKESVGLRPEQSPLVVESGLKVMILLPSKSRDAQVWLTV